MVLRIPLWNKVLINTSKTRYNILDIIKNFNILWKYFLLCFLLNLLRNKYSLHININGNATLHNVLIIIPNFEPEKGAKWIHTIAVIQKIS